MISEQEKKQSLWLWSGDIGMIALVTIVGFSTHNELGIAGSRILTTFIPLLAAWLIVGLPARLFDLQYAVQGRQLWRPVWGMIVAGPLAALIRALILGNRPIFPVFALVLAGVGTVAMLAWRCVLYFLLRGKR